MKIIETRELIKWAKRCVMVKLKNITAICESCPYYQKSVCSLQLFNDVTKRLDMYYTCSKGTEAEERVTQSIREEEELPY